MKIKLQDRIRVLAGKDKGKQSVVTKIFHKHDKVLVEKVNVATKHIKKTSTQPGQKIQIERPIDVSNVQLICPRCSKPTRVAYRVLDNKKKERLCKKCQQPVDKPFAIKK